MVDKACRCRWCGKALDIWCDSMGRDTGRRGFDRNGYFCALRCGLAFAVACVQAGLVKYGQTVKVERRA